MNPVHSLPIIATHPSQAAVLRFDHAEHRYFSCGTGDEGSTDAYELTSVTTFVKAHFPEFNAKAVAERMAARDPSKSAALILAAWEAKRSAASRLGTRVHEAAEDAILERAPRHSPENDRERAMMKNVWNHVQEMRHYGWKIIDAETPVFSDRLGLAGTIDFSARAPDGTLALLDWKTNESIDARAKYGDERGIGPCAGLDHCNLNHYSLQLHLYAEILRVEGYYTAGPVRKTLLHVTPAGVNSIEALCVREVVLAMLLERRLNPCHLPF